MGEVVVYVTSPSHEEAQAIGRALVEERLAAGVNILPGATSLYWWEDRLEEAREVMLLAKTRASLVPALTKRVEDLHSYVCPCVIALPIAAGSARYLEWIRTETEAAATSARDG